MFDTTDVAAGGFGALMGAYVVNKALGQEGDSIPAAIGMVVGAYAGVYNNKRIKQKASLVGLEDGVEIGSKMRSVVEEQRQAIPQPAEGTPLVGARVEMEVSSNSENRDKDKYDIASNKLAAIGVGAIAGVKSAKVISNGGLGYAATAGAAVAGAAIGFLNSNLTEDKLYSKGQNVGMNLGFRGLVQPRRDDPESASPVDVTVLENELFAASESQVESLRQRRVAETERGR